MMILYVEYRVQMWVQFAETSRRIAGEGVTFYTHPVISLSAGTVWLKQ